MAHQSTGKGFLPGFPEFLILLFAVMATAVLLWWQVASGRRGDDLTDRVVAMRNQWSTIVESTQADGSREQAWKTARTATVDELAPLVQLEPPLGPLVDALRSLPLTAPNVAVYGQERSVFDSLLLVLENIRHRQTGAFQNILFFTLALGGLAIGFLVWRTQRLRWSASMESLLAAKANQRGRIQEHERWRIARELHDGVAQELARAKLCFEQLDCSICLQAGNQTIRGNVFEALSLSIKEIRWICGSLRKAAGSETSLEQVLEQSAGEFRARYGLPISVQRINGLGSSWDEASLHEISRMIQEGLTNVTRHSDATSVILRSLAVGSAAKIQVEDDGSGIRNAEGFGMRGVRERAELLGGSA